MREKGDGMGRAKRPWGLVHEGVGVREEKKRERRRGRRGR